MNQIIEGAKKKLSNKLQDQDFIRGFGISETKEGIPCLIIYINHKLKKEEIALIPKKIDNIPVNTRIIRGLKSFNKK